MSTVSIPLTYARQLCQTDSNGIPDANGINFLNDAVLDFRGRLIERDVDAGIIQESYVPTITIPAAGQGSTFAFPPDMYFLKEIEVNFQDTTEQNYIQASKVDESNLPPGVSLNWLRVNQPSNQPLFSNHGSWYETFPTFATGNNLTNAIRIFYFLQPTPYATSGDTLVYIDSLDPYILADKMAALYFESLGKLDEAKLWSDRYESRVERLVETLSPGSKQQTQPESIGLTGFEY